MDPIIAKLNIEAQKKLAQAGGTPQVPLDPSSNSTSFQQTFDKTLTDRLMEKITDMGGANETNVISAENIHVETQNTEVDHARMDAGDSFFNMFKEVNKDLLSLDSALETLTTPGLKISPRQLLALQAGVANTTIMAEAFSRFTDATVRGIQTVVQTQV